MACSGERKVGCGFAVGIFRMGILVFPRTFIVNLIKIGVTRV
jgi:hypothetical protein